MSYKRVYSRKGLSARSRLAVEAESELALEEDLHGNVLRDSINYEGVEMPIKITQQSANANAAPNPGSSSTIRRVRLAGKLDIFPDETKLNAADAPYSQVIRRDMDGFYNAGADTNEVAMSQPGSVMKMQSFGNDPAYNGSKQNLRFLSSGEVDGESQIAIMAQMAIAGGGLGGLAGLGFGGANPSPSRPKQGQGYPSQAPLTSDTQIPDAFIPATTSITSLFGERIHPIRKTKSMHKGVDFGGGKRSQAGWNGLAAKAVATKPEDQEPCFATFDGKVTKVTMNIGKKTGYGCVVYIEHNVKDKGGNDRKIVTRYAHIEYTPLKVGDEVKKGDLVAHIGSQGGSTGPHLHYEVREGSTALDPVEVFGWQLGPPPPPDPSGHVDNDFPEEELDGEDA